MDVKALRILVLLLGTSLAGCANVPKTPQEKLTAMEGAVTQANEAYQSGQSEKALDLLKGAAATNPTDKGPWLKMAQIHFDGTNYGQAIVNAQEVLQRDPGDKVANSIVAVSGLRLSTKSLTVLRGQNDLNGSVRTEAQDLAKILRESIGEEVLVPAPAPDAKKPAVKTSASRKPVAAPAKKNPAEPAKATRDSGGANPFGALK